VIQASRRPAKARAAVLRRPRQLVVEELDLPQVGEDDAILAVEACGLCGTDHEQFSGVLGGGFAFVPGHEVVGVIESLGRRASERLGVEAGQRVAVEVFKSCRACAACSEGRYRFCQRHGLTDMYGYTPLERPPGLWGGYATHLYLDPDALVLSVPSGLDPVVATLFNPLGAGLRWAVELPATSPGDVVVVMGPGIRGICCLVALRHHGAGFVAVTGLGSKDRARLELARELGADLVVDVESADPRRLLMSQTGRLADVVVDVTARAPGALGQAVSLAGEGARVVVAGTKGSPATPGFHPDSLVYKELTLIGALGVDVGAYSEALALLGDRREIFENLPRCVVGFDGLAGLLESMAGEAAGPPPLHGVFRP
jgi:alcohol dehydrogenase